LDLLVPWWIKKWTEVHSKSVDCWIFDLLVPGGSRGGHAFLHKCPCISTSMAFILWYIHLCSWYHKCDRTIGPI
jgi:hypothetical protein